MAHERIFLLDPAHALLAVGLVTLALVPAGMVWALLDARRIGRERAAVKPIKFALSIAIYLLTVSWMLGYLRPDRLSSALVQLSVLGLLVGAIVELCCIVLQAARGRRSHFNTASPVDAAIAGAMAVLAILFVGMLPPLAWEISQRPRPDAPPLVIMGIAGGLVMTFVLGALTGAGMARPAIGTQRSGRNLSPPPRRRARRRLQVAHGLGIHALQAMPMMAWMAAATGGRAAAPLLAAGIGGYSAITLLLLYRPALLPTWPIPDAVPLFSRN